MFTTFTPEKIKEYLAELSHSTFSTEQKKDKIESIEKFLNWAIGKGYIEEYKFNQLTAEIAKFKTIHFTEGYSEAPKLQSIVNRLFKGKSLYTSALVILIGVGCIAAVLGNPAQPGISKAYAAPNTSHILSFKGKIVDKLGNPVDSKTDVTFKVYPSATSTTPLYTGACVGTDGITPDTDGTISVRIGEDCGMEELSSSVFTQNQNLYLGITVGSDPEMQPRKQLANVNYSSNANTLQGLPAGNSTSSVPYINSDGDLLIDAPQASITSVSKSGNFSINSANVLNLQAQNDININSLTDGAIHFKTNGSKTTDSLLIGSNGNIGINGAGTSLFNLQVSGDIGPNFSNVYNLGSFVNQWGAVYSNTFYQNGYQVCDMSKNCSNLASSWSSLSPPTDSLNLTMGSNVTTFTYGSSTSNRDLFNITDSSYNTGTGYLMTLSTAPGSKMNLFHIMGSGSETMSVLQNGNIGVGLSNPTARFQTKESGAKNSDSYGAYLENASDNESTDGINKYGAYISSTGTFTGGTGDATKNYGIYINTTSGADTNYDIYAASGAYLSTGGTWTNASSRDLKENFTPVDENDILNKIAELDLTSWNYKTESDSVKHLGPIAEQFYSLFHLGNSNKSISTIDPSGVALVGIQALTKKVSALEDNTITSVDSEGNVSISATTAPFTYQGVDNPGIENEGTLSLLYNNSIVDSIKAVGKLFATSIKTGYLETENAVITKAAFVKDLSVEKLHSSDKITSPVVEADTVIANQTALLQKVKTSEVAPLDKDLTINLNNSASEEGSQDNKGTIAKVIINGLDNKAVTTIDAAGNIITDGNIKSETATVSGSLTANSIQTENFQSNNVSANTASFSGELVADNIKSKALDQINDKISNNDSSLSSISSQVNDVQKLLADIKNSSPTNPASQDPNFANLNVAGLNLPDNTTVDNFTVNNTATLFRASVTDSLFIGSLIERSTSILSLNTDLNISSLGTISFFENGVTIAKDGSITATGTINAQGGIKTNNIEVQNAEQTTVGSINAQGEGKFKNLALDKYVPSSPSSTVIAAADNYARNGQNAPGIETTSQAAGLGLVPPQSNDVIIYNDSVKADSLIYLTPTTSAPGQTLTVLEKHSCEVGAPQPCRAYFKVGVETELASALNFNWLIIN